MQLPWESSLIRFFTFLCLSVLAIPFAEMAFAAQLTVKWVDNVKNESGFTVERKQGTSGTYSQIAKVEADITSYIDSTVSANTTYCYRVRAYNPTGNSPYMNEVCVTTPTQTYRLSVSLLGNGTLTSNISGINCPTDCGQNYEPGTKVTLTPRPSSGWTFSSWGGSCTGQGSTCVLTMSATKNAMVNFSQENSVSEGGKRTRTVGEVTANLPATTSPSETMALR
jgi:List-Bact-rpt repeat protein